LAVTAEKNIKRQIGSSSSGKFIKREIGSNNSTAIAVAKF
jgi:hypothetical protein